MEIWHVTNIVIILFVFDSEDSAETVADKKDDIEKELDEDQEREKEEETEEDIEEEKEEENEEKDKTEEEVDKIKEQEKGEDGEEEAGIFSSDDDEDDELLASIIKLKEVRIPMVQAKFDLLYLHHIETNFNSSAFGISPTTDMIQVLCNGTVIAENWMVKLEQAVGWWLQPRAVFGYVHVEHLGLAYATGMKKIYVLHIHKGLASR